MERWVRRWEHEGVIEATLQHLNDAPNSMNIRGRTVEYSFGTIKAWRGATHFLVKGLKYVATEMCLSVLAYSLKRMTAIMGVKPLIAAIQS